MFANKAVAGSVVHFKTKLAFWQASAGHRRGHDPAERGRRKQMLATVQQVEHEAAHVVPPFRERVHVGHAWCRYGSPNVSM